MKRNVTRRDFLNGTQVAIGASLLNPFAEVFGATPPAITLGDDYYPPAKTGLRGSHDGSWETMHARVAGATWPPGDVDARYDLVVVGAGISGLSAAHSYRQQKPSARILILDNHDDFGGHAKRNEFQINGQTRIAYGGTEAIDTPSSYQPEAKQLLKDIGIDVQKFYDLYHMELYSSMGLGKGIHFSKEIYGKDKLVSGYNKRPWEEFIAETPMNEQAKRDFLRLWTEKKDYLPGLSREEKLKKLDRMSYNAFLRDVVKVDQDVLEIFRRWGMSFWCVGSDEIPASSVQSYDGGMPGLNETLPRVGYRGDEPYIFHFPDGNASVARLLVRQLIPAAVPGDTMEDSVTARVDYSELDRAGTDTQIRLNSTVVSTQHSDGDKSVDVVYVNGGKPYTVRADNCILACYNSAIPYICNELPEQQKKDLAYNVKIPLTYTKVMLPNWRAFADQGLDFIYYTNGFFKQAELSYPVSIGDYKFGTDPDQPMVVHMCYVPYFADIQGPDQWRAGRRKLLETPFSEFEHNVRTQLDQGLGHAGFDADRDIHAITVNRWPHGYSYSPDLTWEQDYASEADKPWVRGRKAYGRISIANSDAGAAANTDSAITHGLRAAQEVLNN